MPITTINGGTNAERIVRLKPQRYKKPTLHTTPVSTTSSESTVTLKERKNSSSINALNIMEPIKK